MGLIRSLECRCACASGCEREIALSSVRRRAALEGARANAECVGALARASALRRASEWDRPRSCSNDEGAARNTGSDKWRGQLRSDRVQVKREEK
eukprot:3893018-Pleurochrysis_carterae.AAC.2